MKKSISYLPKSKQGDLVYLVLEIRKKLPEAEMIILYGSYARDEEDIKTLNKLSASVKSYSPDLVKVFPRYTAEEKRLFNLLKAAYVEARYNPNFIVTKEDLDMLIPKVELLRDIAKRICAERIAGNGEIK